MSVMQAASLRVARKLVAAARVRVTEICRIPPGDAAVTLDHDGMWCLQCLLVWLRSTSLPTPDET